MEQPSLANTLPLQAVPPPWDTKQKSGLARQWRRRVGLDLPSAWRTERAGRASRDLGGAPESSPCAKISLISRFPRAGSSHTPARASLSFLQREVALTRCIESIKFIEERELRPHPRQLERHRLVGTGCSVCSDVVERWNDSGKLRSGGGLVVTRIMLRQPGPVGAARAWRAGGWAAFASKPANLSAVWEVHSVQPVAESNRPCKDKV